MVINEKELIRYLNEAITRNILYIAEDEHETIGMARTIERDPEGHIYITAAKMEYIEE